MVGEENSIRDLVASTVAGLYDAVEGKNVGVCGVVEFELSVVSKKTAGGKLKLVLAEAGAGYNKEEISRIKFWIGSRRGTQFKAEGWR